MEDFLHVLGEIEHSLGADTCYQACYAHNNQSFKNGSKLPINQIHLERYINVKVKELPDSLDVNKLSTKEFSQYYETRKEIVPALHKSWIPKHFVVYNYQPYYFTTDISRNSFFIKNNKNFIKMLAYLLECSFHEFWCVILFEPAVPRALMSFLLNAIAPYDVVHLKNDFAQMYETIFSYFFWVYEKLLTFWHSPEEYMSEKFGLKSLLDTSLLSLSAVVILSLLYKNHNRDFVNHISKLYFNDKSQKKFHEKELEDKINHTKLVFEMIEMLVCRNTELVDVVPIAIDPRPANFSLQWVHSVVSYLLHTVASLNTLFEIYRPTVKKAYETEMPTRLCFTYETVYSEIYDMLDGRKELEDDPELTNIIFDQIAAGRSEFLNAYNAFVSDCLDKTLASQHDHMLQEEYIESYFRLINIALENECFICDYHMKFSVDITNEMFSTYCNIDSTRTDYIMKCINNLPRTHKLSEIMKQRQTIEDSFRNNAPKKREIHMPPVQSNGVVKDLGPSEDEIDVKVKDIMDMFPHLGDGFILKCLEAYDFKTHEVINAVLEQNLPPHITEVPFDLVRIPPEPEPPQPVLAYRGKKPDYKDAVELLDDRKAKEEMKTYVLEGIKYGTNYDPYDDEYDDREDELPIPIHVADNGGDEITRFNPNYAADDLASDTSYSDEEYDDEGKPIGKGAAGNSQYPSTSQGGRNRDHFCEDPAVIRARREANYRGRGRGGGGGKNPTVVGKPKGQGQDKNTQHSRQVKNVNKSSKANHNRKTGAQWKRSRGMMPS